VPELETHGHQVIAVDLPCEDMTATFESYAEIVVNALEVEDATDVVVVGHSLGGLTIPLVAVRWPVRRLVYLCAGVPIPRLSMREQLALEPDTRAPGCDVGLEPDDQGRTCWVSEAGARRVLYGDCEVSVSHGAFERLRPQAQTPLVQPCPLDTLPPTPSTYIVCRDDRRLNPEHCRKVARGRLDAELIELPGSHSPMLSRPGHLATVLHERCQDAG
jgi:pimeloyl-ACP methyl ester carboxylesterase